MALAVVLFPVSKEVVALQPTALEALARLGVTSVSLVRDAETAGLVLEGWAFDPARAHEAATSVTGSCDEARALQPVVQMAVSSAAIDNRGRKS
ncbi:MAG: hypothetical protein M3345_05320 [Actinomycetota bacterium]|nr:hypothetical protein [Actinomycetota bacterium]